MIFIRLDENIAPQIKTALKAIGIPQGVVIEIPDDHGERSQPDKVWIDRFGKRGKETDKRVTISGDGAMRFREAERAALESAGLIAIFVPESRYWRALKRHGQAALLIRWMLDLIWLAETSPPGAQYRMPNSFEPRALKPLPAMLAPRPPRKRPPRQAKPGSLL